MKTRANTAVKGVEKRSVSAPARLFAEADKRAEERRMTNFSEYVRDLVRQDVEGKLPTQSAHEVELTQGVQPEAKAA